MSEFNLRTQRMRTYNEFISIEKAARFIIRSVRYG